MTILLVEDDANLGFMVQEHLELHGYRVQRCVDGEEGLRFLEKNGCDLVLLDIMMPKLDGFALARKVRAARNEVPIIFLTARSLKEDRLEGLRIGADDYVTKPFSVEELLLRVRAVLKRSNRSQGEQEQAGSFVLGSYSFDLERNTLTRGRRSRRLTEREAALLRLLCERRNRTLGRQEALQTIWEDDSYYAGRSMDVFITRLRKYLAADPSVTIANVHGKGFRLRVKSKG